MEEEATCILSDVCMAGGEQQPAQALQRWVDELYGESRPTGVVDELIAGRHSESSKAQTS